MGVSVKISLPAHVADDDICAMMAICAGGKAVKRDFSGTEGWSAEVEGITFKSDGYGRFPDMIQVEFPDAQKQQRSVSYFPRGGDAHGPLMIPPSNPFWIAIGHRLLAAYGGKMSYDDGADGFDLIKPHKNALVKKKDFLDGNEGFYNRQRALLGAYPITPKELMEANENAAYPYDLNPEGFPLGDGARQVLAFNTLVARLREIEALEKATLNPGVKPRARKGL